MSFAGPDNREVLLRGNGYNENNFAHNLISGSATIVIDILSPTYMESSGPTDPIGSSFELHREKS